MFKGGRIHWIVWVLLGVAILDVAALGWVFRAEIGSAIAWIFKNWTWEWVFRAAEIVALATAFWAAWGAYRHAQRLKDVTQALSTRFIGAFPEHLDEITKRVSAATKSIRILADCVDYGSFQPEAHAQLLHAHLIALAKPTKISILIWGPPQAMSRANKYRDPKLRKGVKYTTSARELLKKWKADAEFDAALPQLLAACAKEEPRIGAVDVERVRNCVRSGKLEDVGAFEAVQLCLHQRIRERLLGHETRIVCNPQPELDPDLFFWIIDGKEALFALPTEGRDAPLFYTSDKEVVLALMENFRQKMALSGAVGDF